jgi:hypothetical protein
MREAFTAKGLWWLPETPGERAAGVLTYMPDAMSSSITLELVSEEEVPLFCYKQAGVINGITDKGEITLRKCSQLSKTIKTSNVLNNQYCTTTISALQIFVGYLFSRENSILVHSQTITVTQLHEWMGLPKPRISRKDERIYSETSDGGSIELIEIEGVKISAGSWINFSANLDATFIKTRGDFYLEALQPVHYDRLDDLAHKIQSLFYFFIGQPVHNIEETIKLINKKSESEKVADHIEVNIIKSSPRLPDEARKTIPSIEHIVSCPTLKDQLGFVITKYFAEYEKIEPSLSLFMRLKYGFLITSLEDKFLMSVRALEAFHINVHDGNKNTYLKFRLRDLFDKTSAIRDNLPYDLEEFLASTVHTRDYFTHYGTKKEKVLEGYADLFHYIYFLNLLFEVSFLDWLGLLSSDVKGKYAYQCRNYKPIVTD